MQVKLTMRSVPMPGGAPSVPKPFLTFTCRGPNLNMVQDLPISKPHMPARAAAPPARVCPPSPAHELPISRGLHAATPCPSVKHALWERGDLWRSPAQRRAWASLTALGWRCRD